MGLQGLEWRGQKNTAAFYPVDREEPKRRELSGRIDLVAYAQASPMQEVLKFMSSLGYRERFCLKKLRQ